MAGHKNWRTLLDKMEPERRKRVEAGAKADVAGILLAELRKIEGMTQVELAEKLGVRQSAISQLEQQDDMQISTLQRLVSALGGVLEITVRLPGGQYKLGQFYRRSAE